jgi:hypothetical protein
MNKTVLTFSILSIMTMVFLAGCSRGPQQPPTQQPPILTAAPEVHSENIESASSSAESSADNFVNDATPTSDQVVPDLT